MYDKDKLDELLRFTAVRPGATVIDVYPGAGDWTRLFSGAVGREGRVISFVPTEIADIKPDQAAAIGALVKQEGLGNVDVVSADLVALTGGGGSGGRRVCAPLLSRPAHRTDPAQGSHGDGLQPGGP
jgi:predicted methyltransferase